MHKIEEVYKKLNKVLIREPGTELEQQVGYALQQTREGKDYHQRSAARHINRVQSLKNPQAGGARPDPSLIVGASAEPFAAAQGPASQTLPWTAPRAHLTEPTCR